MLIQPRGSRLFATVQSSPMYLLWLMAHVGDSRLDKIRQNEASRWESALPLIFWPVPIIKRLPRIFRTRP